MLKRFFLNTKKPEDTLGGQFMLWLMNKGHRKNALWGFNFLPLQEATSILDIGCGGGMNIREALIRAPKAKVHGVDYSKASIKKASTLNSEAVQTGRAEFRLASVENLPYETDTFDVITAFETVYFWPDLKRSFADVNRLLRSGGRFLICNEAANPEDAEKWSAMLDMRVYTGAELGQYMEQAGFEHIEIHEHENGKWICVVGRHRM